MARPGNFSMTGIPAGTYLMYTIDLTGKGYTLVSLHPGTLGGTGSLSQGEILNISIGSGANGQNYYFGMQLPGGGTGEHP